MEPVPLRTARLALTAPTLADVDALVEACQDPDIPRYTAVPSPYGPDDARTFIAKVESEWASAAQFSWLIRREDGLAGMIGLYRVTPGAAEIGYWMARGARGQGLLSEAAHAVLDWGFATDGLALERIEWRAVVGNTASAASARATGFRYEGLLRKSLTGKNGREDGWVAGLLATDDRTPQAWSILSD